jgi:hypothetical protein
MFLLGFVDMRQLVLLVLGAEAQTIHQFERVAQRLPTLKAVLYLAKDFADLVFDRVGTFGTRPEALQVRKQFTIDVVNEVNIAGQRFVVIESPVALLWPTPTSGISCQ